MAECQRSHKFLFGILVLYGIHHHRIGGAYTLVATSTVAHHGNHRSAHSCVASRCSFGDDMREDAVAEDALGERAVDGLAEVMSVVALDGILCCLHVIVFGLQYEHYLVERSLSGKFVHHLKIEADVIFL